ncbi:MAG: hypothetical protein KBS41_02940, partial [Oscillospiraceae bacterium]|nr:hypothetical protein [Candidatus Equicaccousia limihippi]
MKNSVCFIGHRKVQNPKEIENTVRDTVKALILKGYNNFIFGSRSQFNDICFTVVKNEQKLNPSLKTIEFRPELEHPSELCSKYSSHGHDKTLCPKGLDGAGRARYVERNAAMINASEICVFYYDKNYLPPRRKHSKNDLTDYQPKSGTAIAY